MDRVDLERELARIGQTIPQPGQGYHWPRFDPPALMEANERGAPFEVPFDSEDELCRWWLVRALLGKGRSTGHGAAPEEAAWRRSFAPLSVAVARGAGLLVVADTASVWADGVDGVLLATAVDVRGGDVRWSAPLDGLGHARTFAVAGDVVLAADRDGVRALDAATGVQRWRVGSPWADPDEAHGKLDPRSSGTRPVVAIPLHDGRRALLVPLRFGNPRTPAVSIDLATGRTVWRAEVQVPVPHGPVRRADAFALAVVSRGELGVFRATLADQRLALRLRAPAPAGFDRARLHVIFERDGLAVAESLGAHDDWPAQAVLAEGHAEAVFTTNGALPRHSAPQVIGLDAHRFVVRERDRTALFRVDARGHRSATPDWSPPPGTATSLSPLWVQDSRCDVLAAGPDACLVQRGAGSGAHTAVIGDDGTERGSAKGMLLGVAGGRVALAEYLTDLVVRDMTTGAEVLRARLAANVATARLRWPHGFDAADGHVVTHDGDLAAWPA